MTGRPLAGHMRKIFFALCVLCIVGSYRAEAQAFKKLTFDYSPYEGEGQLACTHKPVEENPYMFNVDCGEGRRTFTATLAMTRMLRDEEPRTYLEIIYSLIDDGTPEHPGPSFSSQMTLVFLDEKASVRRVFMSQGVENGQSRLAVEFEY